MRQISEITGSKDKLGGAHNLLAASYFHSGNLKSASLHFDRATMYGQHTALIRSCHTIWLLGYAEQAKANIAKAIFNSRQTNDSHDLCWTLDFSSYLDFMLRDYEKMGNRRQEVNSLLHKYDFPFYRASSHFMRGWEYANKGLAGDAWSAFNQGKEAREKLGARIFQPLWNCLIIESLQQTMQYKKALNITNKAIQDTKRTGEEFLTAELYRLKGMLNFQLYGTIADSEAHYNVAIGIARQQNARSLELRATTSLCRLLQEQGRIETARQTLSEIYKWFSEGFDTADLVEAKALLDELEQVGSILES